MTPEQFANALVAVLSPILPAGFAVRAAGDVVHIDAPDGLGSSTSLAYLDPDDADAQDYADAAWNVLSMVQDVVSETVADPWPAAAGSGSDLAEPGTRVEGVSVALYFGPDEAPVTVLGSIPLEA